MILQHQDMLIAEDPYFYSGEVFSSIRNFFVDGHAGCHKYFIFNAMKILNR